MRDPRVSAKGDLVVGIGNNEVTVVAVGAPDLVLTADPTVVAGVSWQSAAGGGGLQGHGTTGLVTGTFGPAGDTGAFVMCPAAYRAQPVAASVGNVLLWVPGFFHESDSESMHDLCSVVGGVPARYLSSGTAVQAASGHGGLYLGLGLPQALRAQTWVVAAEDLDGGAVTLAFMFRDSGSGNTMGHAALPGQVDVINMGGPPA